MHTSYRFAALGLCLLLAGPAFGTPRSALLGRWQGHPRRHSRLLVLDFKRNGTETLQAYRGRRLVPLQLRDGRTAVLRYRVRGDRLIVTTRDGRHSESARFRLRGDVLTFLPNGRHRGTAVFRRIRRW